MEVASRIGLALVGLGTIFALLAVAAATVMSSFIAARGSDGEISSLLATAVVLGVVAAASGLIGLSFVVASRGVRATGHDPRTPQEPVG